MSLTATKIQLDWKLSPQSFSHEIMCLNMGEGGLQIMMDTKVGERVVANFPVTLQNEYLASLLEI